VKELTERQRQVLDFIRSFGERHGVPPTVREIGERFRFTARAAFDHLRALERKGMLERRVTGKRASRTLVLPAQKGARRGEPSGIPVMGRIAAGTPITAVENQEDTLPLRPDWLPTGGSDVFALRVQGDSMIDAHIMSGDLVVVRKQETAQSGQTVVALVNGEATVKTYFKKATHIELRPANTTMPPILVQASDEFHIEGVLIGVIRHCAM